MPQARTFRHSLVALAVAGAFGLGALAAEQHIVATGVQAAPAAAPVVAVAPATPTSALPDFADLVARHGAAVVQIDSVRSLKKTAMDDDENALDSEDLPPFFRNLPNMPKFQRPDRAPARGLGSGFIVGDGIVLTNAHVVDGADEVTVKLEDRREFKAKVLGVDKATDVAVLRIDAKGLPMVRTGDPKTTRVGEWVVAIGAPYGLDHTVTSGIVSAKSRSLPGEGVVPFIQTDAAVNPGNSGGPLFNLRGEVIGINSQIFSRSGGFQGVAFAIPIDVALNVKDQIIANGKVSHGKLGVSVQEVNQSLAESFGMKAPAGALVGSVQKGGPGAKAGIEPGDVIVTFNGTPIERSSDLPPLVATLKPGSTVPFEVWRNGEKKELRATVGTRDEEKVADAGSVEHDKGKLGVSVRPLAPEEKKAANLDAGVVVENVGGAAAKAGVQKGDVILSVNRQKVDSVEKLKELIGKSGKVAALLIQRDEGRIFIPVPLA